MLEQTQIRVWTKVFSPRCEAAAAAAGVSFSLSQRPVGGRRAAVKFGGKLQRTGRRNGAGERAELGKIKKRCARRVSINLALQLACEWRDKGRCVCMWTDGRLLYRARAYSRLAKIAGQFGGFSQKISIDGQTGACKKWSEGLTKGRHPRAARATPGSARARLSGRGPERERPRAK